MKFTYVKTYVITHVLNFKGVNVNVDNGGSIIEVLLCINGVSRIKMFNAKPH